MRSNPATISGSILDANFEPTTGGAVTFIDPFGNQVVDAWVDGDGNFAIDLTDGEYRAITRFTNGVIDDVWDGVNGAPCANQLCDFQATGTPIVVSGGVMKAEAG